MRYGEFITIFNRHVIQLDYDSQLELAIAVCKKLYFDYQYFSEFNQWGSPDFLLDAIAFCEQARYKKVEKASVDAKLAKLESVTPDMDDFGDLNSTYALNACVAIYETLQFLIAPSPKHIYDVGICLTDTIDFKVQGNDNLPEKEIDKHPEMIEARSFLLQLSTPKPINQLKFAIQALSLEAEGQLASFPVFVVVTDELMLEYDNWKNAAITNHPNYFSQEQLKSLKDIDTHLNTYEPANPGIPIAEELRSSPFWKELRMLAKDALLKFNWMSERPPENRVTYIEG